MTDTAARPGQAAATTQPENHSMSRAEPRHVPIRANSDFQAVDLANESENASGHRRGKSAYYTYGQQRASLPKSAQGKPRRSIIGLPEWQPASLQTSGLDLVSDPSEDGLSPSAAASNLLTPPITPRKDSAGDIHDASEMKPDTIRYDFSRIDYELDRTRLIGKGLWSSVYFASPVAKSPKSPGSDILTPPSTPQRQSNVPPCSFYAVKTPSRPDAKTVFLQEARILTALQRSQDADQYVIPFHGLDSRNSSLVFEGVLGGSLESVPLRLKVMTELERHLELRTLFPELARNLVSGLRFIHDAGIVHADIKPANILLDILDHEALSNPVIRARYIDFSASFVSDQDSAANAGGTWDFMAPEQLRIQKELNTPTFASDVWSLGITLLFVIAGVSPYFSYENNLFMLREAIKSGDPLGFARMEPVVQKRMAACQDFVDCCRLALQKDRSRRPTAEGWERWLANEITEWSGMQ